MPSYYSMFVDLQGKRCLEAWATFRPMLTAHFWKFVLYLLFQIAIAIVMSALIMAAVVATCCIAGCLISIPFLGTVLMLPLLVFSCAYSLYYLAQYGPEYNVFQPTSVS